jgi:lysophospholipase L1-like esterase
VAVLQPADGEIRLQSPETSRPYANRDFRSVLHFICATFFRKRMVHMADVQPNSAIPVHAAPFAHPLPNFASRLGGIGPIKVVAIGSSSTAGEGGIVPYTYRVETALRAKYPGRMIDVLNRGIGGQEAPEELDRMQADVIDEKPALVIWQVGTNAVWQPGRDLDKAAAAIAAGLTLLGRQAMDVVLMDLQYVPALLTDDKIAATRRMLSLIANAAANAGVNVFGRFAMMQRWLEIERFSFDVMVDPTDVSRLHQSDWSAGRIGYEFCQAIADAAARPAQEPV